MTEHDFVIQHLDSLSRKIETIASDHAMSRSDIQSLRNEIVSFRRDYEQHVEQDHREIISGFNGDPEGHANIHREEKRKRAESDDIIKETKKKIISGGAWAFFIFCGTSAWHYIKTQVLK